MIKTMRRILKADEVTFNDPLPLDLESARSHDGPPPDLSARPQVRITQNHAQYAVLEVTCSCGQKIHVRCDYGVANLSPDPQTPAQV